MLLEGLCDAPRLGMHLYMLVHWQTCGHGGTFVVSFASEVKTQFIEKHNNDPGIYHAYEWYTILVIYHGYL
jgi:hypothetical protein